MHAKLNFAPKYWTFLLDYQFFSFSKLFFFMIFDILANVTTINIIFE